MLGLIAVSNTAVPWFLGDGYEESKNLIKIGSFLVMAIGLNNVSGIQYLIPAKKQSLYTKSVVAAAIVNLTLNYLLISHFKARGAILASVIAEFSIVFIQLWSVRKDFDISIAVKNSWKYIVSSIIMFIPIYIIGLKVQPTIYMTAMQVVIAIVIYGIMLLILKDSFVKSILKDMKEKLLKDRR